MQNCHPDAFSESETPSGPEVQASHEKRSISAEPALSPMAVSRGTIRLIAEVRDITDTDERDVFVAGYPRSGNTWCQSCIAAMMYGFDIARTPETMIQSLVPDVHYSEQYLRFQTPTVFKTHALPQPHYRRVIHLLRDGRDAMTSFYHYARDSTGIAGNDWESIMRTGAFDLTHWHEHVHAWLENPHDAEIITIRYEDLKRNPVPTLGKMAEFLKLALTKNQLRQIAEMTTFSRMRDRERRLGWVDEFPKDKAHVRRGIIGSYKDEMPPETLKHFEKVSETALRATGYWAEDDRASENAAWFPTSMAEFSSRFRRLARCAFVRVDAPGARLCRLDGLLGGKFRRE